MPIDNAEFDRRTDVIIDAKSSSDEEFGMAVLTAIADELEADPSSIPPIQHSIDTDLLNSLREADDTSETAVAFQYLGHDVVVTSDGFVRLR